MRRFFFLLLFTTYSCLIQAQDRPFGLVVHGGAGWITPDRYTAEQEKAYRDALEGALKTGYTILEKGGSAEEAIVQTLSQLEDNPLFNAGKGSVLTADGKASMDASLMLGQDLSAGAVAGVETTRHPIQAASAVLHHSPHVLLSGSGADAFAAEQALAQEKPKFFITASKKENLERAKAAEKTSKHGTVGCVALDRSGNLAAGTSTGGMNNKKHGRIGDSPIIGAGTYANNRSCAISCTGHGEYFIRLGVAKEVSSLMLYRQYDLYKAAHYVIHKQLTDLGGDGGLIALDRKGNIALPFNTPGMFRGYHMSDRRRVIKMFKEE